MEQKLKGYLEKHCVRYAIYEHPAVFTVAESKKLKHEVPGLHCKCLFLKDDSTKFYLVAMPAEKRLDMKKLRAELDVKKLHFATEGELLDKLGLKPGSVSIFGLINNVAYDVMFIVDKEVWDAESVGFHPNVNTATLVLKHEDLERFYNSIHNPKEIKEL